MAPDLLHNSRMTCFRSPQGALKAGETLYIALTASQSYARAEVMLRLALPTGEQRVPMQRAFAEDGARFACSVLLPDTPCLCRYFFEITRPGGELRYYGGTSGEGMLTPHEPPSYQVTIYDPAFTTPGWFREGIMYQVFPDRFCRAGDSKPGLSYHRAMGREPRIHKDWSEQPYFLPADGETDYVPNDFFLGDLAGISQKLPYLKTLGVTCLYLNPVFESGSNHRYDTADYLRIDPILGTNEDMRALVLQCREHGMRIMLDGVFSHTGADSAYFNKYGRYSTVGAYQSAQSPYRDWYDFHSLVVNGYRTWWGFPELPEVNELSPAYLDFVIEGQQSLLRHWADFGITSWRLDVADELPDAFVRAMRARLKQIDPNSVLLGEVWEDASNKEAYGQLREYVQGYELDSVMNYPFQEAVIAFLTGRKDAYWLHNALCTLRERYPKPFYYAAMNLLSSHDIVRALTQLGGAPDRRTTTREVQAHFALTAEQEVLAKHRLVMATALQMMLPGVPSIYYGDEVGVGGMGDPFNRATFPWGHEDQALLQAFRALCTLRSQRAALRGGYCRMGICTQDVFALLRYTSGGCDAFGGSAADEALLLLVNRSLLPVHVRFCPENVFCEGQDAEVGVPFAGIWKQTDGEKSFTLRDGMFEVVLPACAALIFAHI